MKFLTKYIKNNRETFRHIEAKDWKEAEEIVKQSENKNEQVIGSIKGD